MKGSIKTYNDSKGFGFILGDDDNDYFFHISNVKFVEEIERGTRVEFKVEKGEKGNAAVDVRLKLAPNFINIGGVRLVAANIKNYGISSGNRYYEKKGTYRSPFSIEPEYEYTDITDRYDPFAQMFSKHQVVTEVHRYLYITTYTGDNYKFWENKVDFDIEKKLEELDEYMV